MGYGIPISECVSHLNPTSFDGKTTIFAGELTISTSITSLDPLRRYGLNDERLQELLGRAGAEPNGLAFTVGELGNFGPEIGGIEGILNLLIYVILVYRSFWIYFPHTHMSFDQKWEVVTIKDWN